MTDQHQPMTPERLAEIEALCTAAGAPFTSPHPQSAGCIIPELLAEVRRQSEHIAALERDAANLREIASAETERHRRVIQQNTEDWRALRAEDAERRARIAALETGLRTACDLLDEWIECHTALDSCEDEPDWATSTRLRVLADTTKET